MTTVLRRQIMSDPKVVFEPVLGRWRVEYRTQWTDEWQTHRYHHTLEKACEVAQEMTNNDLDGVYRVVDTQPDAEGEHAADKLVHSDLPGFVVDFRVGG